jgi:hypothetical protein
MEDVHVKLIPGFSWQKHPSTRRKMCILYNQLHATYTVFFIIISALHVSGGFTAHHQELIKLYVQPCEQFQLIHASGRQQESMTMPKAPDYGRKNRPKHVER